MHDDQTVKMFPKGPAGRSIIVPIGARTWAALQDWLKVRPQHERFFGLTDPSAVNRRVSHWGALAGYPEARPHGFRHSAVTRALDLMQGNVREVQRFSRHKKTETVLRYDDSRGEVAKKVIDLLEQDS